jgi:hypothetical protein
MVVVIFQPGKLVINADHSRVQDTDGIPEVFASRRGALLIPPVGRDDKERTATDLYFHESDGKERRPIRLANLKVSNHSPLVIPTNGRDLQCASPGRISLLGTL